MKLLFVELKVRLGPKVGRNSMRLQVVRITHCCRVQSSAVVFGAVFPFVFTRLIQREVVPIKVGHTIIPSPHCKPFLPLALNLRRVHGCILLVFPRRSHPMEVEEIPCRRSSSGDFVVTSGHLVTQDEAVSDEPFWKEPIEPFRINIRCWQLSGGHSCRPDHIMFSSGCEVPLDADWCGLGLILHLGRLDEFGSHQRGRVFLLRPPREVERSRTVEKSSRRVRFSSHWRCSSADFFLLGLFRGFCQGPLGVDFVYFGFHIGDNLLYHFVVVFLKFRLGFVTFVSFHRILKLIVGHVEFLHPLFEQCRTRVSVSVWILSQIENNSFWGCRYLIDGCDWSFAVEIVRIQILTSEL
uniref:Uncharacterized protein n=1 Tax=Cacopsylla melanoneura TaxID=428564 RepID=A0A8D8V941_9HEMI